MKLYTDVSKPTLILLLPFVLCTGPVNAETQPNTGSRTWLVKGCNEGSWLSIFVPGGTMISSAIKLDSACLGIALTRLNLSSGTGSWKWNKADGTLQGYTLHQLDTDGDSPKIVVLTFRGKYQDRNTRKIEVTMSGSVFDADDYVNTPCTDDCVSLPGLEFPAEFTFFLPPK